MAPAETEATDLKRTPLYDLHVAEGAKLVPFAGYEMPVSYPLGILKEHLQTRQAAGLFDVSHMGQARLTGVGVDAAIESLVPGDIQGLAPGETRYSLLLNETGGILDDLMITRPGDDPSGSLFLVVNAACKDADFAHIEKQLAGKAELERLDGRALLALQGPKAAEVLARHCAEATDLGFLSMAPLSVAGIDCLVSRSGYTGEDGFEISVEDANAEALAKLPAFRIKPTAMPRSPWAMHRLARPTSCWRSSHSRSSRLVSSRKAASCSRTCMPTRKSSWSRRCVTGRSPALRWNWCPASPAPRPWMRCPRRPRWPATEPRFMVPPSWPASCR